MAVKPWELSLNENKSPRVCRFLETEVCGAFEIRLPFGTATDYTVQQPFPLFGRLSKTTQATEEPTSSFPQQNSFARSGASACDSLRLEGVAPWHWHACRLLWRNGQAAVAWQPLL